MKKILLLAFFTFTFHSIFAQMLNGIDTLYGNEWINYKQSYYKIKVAEDGIYRFNAQDLSVAGIPISTVKGAQFQLFALGREIPMYVSNKGNFQNSDYIEFFGKKNRGELDAALYAKPALEQMNPSFSLFNDTLSYFLTWSNTNSTANFTDIPNTLSNLPTKDAYYLHQIDSTFVSFDLDNGGFDKLNTIVASVDKISTSSYDLAEGFASTYENKRTLDFKLNGIVKNTVAATVSMRLGFETMNGKTVGTVYTPPPGLHSYQIKWNNTLLKADSFVNSFRVKDYSLAIDNALLNASNTFSIEHKYGPSDRHRIATLRLTYPRIFDFENKKTYFFNIEASNIVRYIEIQNFNASANNIVLYDLTNNLRLIPTIDNGVVKIALPPSSKLRNLALINTTQVKTASVAPTSFVNFNTNTGNYIIVSHPSYYKDPKSNNQNWVQEYANYRSGLEGGSYNSIVVDIQQVYDQFGYGIDRHAISLRNFANYTSKVWKSKFLFLIGKGLEYREARDPKYFKNFASYLTVPTFGYPGSDNLIPATPWSIRQNVPIGRIAALSPNDIRVYLKKVKEFEKVQRDANTSIDDKLWMKNIIHLVGGEDAFQNSLGNMGNIITNNKFGGKVYTFYKTSTDPVQSSNSEVVRNLIKKGVSIVNFYGHSSAGNISFALDGAADMGNKGRYFYFLAHGCYSGQVHIPQKSLGPNYLFEDDAGAIAFAAPTSYGLPYMLDAYGTTFYSQLGGNSYNKSNGEAIQNTINTFDKQTGIWPVLNNMTYQGDPAIKMNPSPSPDYIIDLASVKFEPEVVTTLTDRFKLKYSAYNIGRVDKDTVSVSLIRELPDGSRIVVKKDTIKGFIYSKDLEFNIQGLGDFSAGRNKFYLKIDADNKVIELPASAESNNEVNDGKGIELFILTNDVNLLEPRNFSIVNKNAVTLKALPSNVLAPTQKYIFEIDTTADFNSISKIKKELTQSGGVLSWTPTLTFKDSTVYYWRVSPDSTAKSTYTWRSSSFVYIKNASEGWNQSHFFQFKNNDFTYMDLLRKDRRFNYQGNSTGLIIKNNFFEAQRPSIGINEITSTFTYYAVLQGQNAGVMCWVFNDTTGLPWVARYYPGTPKYNASIEGYAYTNTDYFFPYRTDIIDKRKDLIKFLDTIPSKSYVVFMTVQFKGTKYYPEKWAADSTLLGKNIFSVLEKQGAKKIRDLEKRGSVPYFYFYRKNDPTFVGAEKIADPANPDVTIGYNAEIKGYWYQGKVKSVNIGPASKWSAVHWKQSEVEVKDSTFLNIYGIKKDKKEDLLIAQTLKTSLDIAAIDPNIYPNLRLEWFTRDSTKRTSPQLKFWRVLYDGVPEVVPNASKLFTFQSDTLQQGQPMYLSLAAENVSKYDMKNLLVKYNLKKPDNTQLNFYQKYKALLTNDTVALRFKLETKNLSGKNNLTVQLNPNKDQIEQDTTNNFAFLNFFVEKDKRNPNVDVTFDGQRILNGDIISPEPNIVIQMKDENKYLLLSDTSLFKIYLRAPDQNKAELVPFSNPKLKFTPATSTNNNRATVEFNPKLIKDGDYELLIKATDASGNKVNDYQLTDKEKGNSDFYNYKVSFKVITKSSISKILNYPNPFTTSTHFVYTLTGKEPPAYFKIQVMSVSGKVVRELTQADLGPLRTGTHQTDKDWDGTDTFGDRLANGVYLYKIIAKKANGEDYESHDTGADQFFKNGVGKMVILR
jgi:Peptidase family C25